MEKHLLLVDDQPDILDSLEAKINERFPDFRVTKAFDCDHAFSTIIHPSQKIDLLILDLEFLNNTNKRIPNGKALMNTLKEKDITLPTIIYTADLSLLKLHPIIQSHDPAGIVTKDHQNHKDLYFAIEKVLNGGKHYTDAINRQLRRRIKIEHNMDAVDDLIIKYLPTINTAADWKDTPVPVSSKTIKAKLDRMYIDFDVVNDKQLLLKLMRLGYIE
ncbi:response regulator [Marinirhabdus gelatinilytica]|uniref:Response regulator receiver domain-containing protein n=1 Tax=Marinirhabdus gelatinilytica TaxID=1703343 RepID=A0A370Q647_9FLAO|nr:response regulator [Marinirhabdus gelatinilytica]RDK83833.1 response regulator receiver domain-containing protein [Marinirhabdus gelatinilytica]